MSIDARHIADKLRAKALGLNVAVVGLKTITHPTKPPLLAIRRSFPHFLSQEMLTNSILEKGILLLMTTQKAKGIWTARRTTGHCQRHEALSAYHASTVFGFGRLFALQQHDRQQHPCSSPDEENGWDGARLCPRNFTKLSFALSRRLQCPLRSATVITRSQ